MAIKTFFFIFWAFRLPPRTGVACNAPALTRRRAFRYTPRFLAP